MGCVDSRYARTLPARAVRPSKGMKMPSAPPLVVLVAGPNGSGKRIRVRLYSCEMPWLSRIFTTKDPEREPPSA
jgi:hypothetical protein